MIKEIRQLSHEITKNKESIIDKPPQIILVFDYESTGEENTAKRLKAQLTGDVSGSIGEEVASNVMDLRAAVAALIYHSSLYDDEHRPTVCCFAGAHKPGGTTGSAAVKEHLKKFGIKDEDIVTRENTITTKFDIMELFAYMFANEKSVAAIVTTDGHIARVKQEIKNNKARKDKYTFYVIGPSSNELTQLPYSPERKQEMKNRLQEIETLKEKDPGGGLTELVAYILSVLSANSWVRRNIQEAAEEASHPYFPPPLERLMKGTKRRKR